jgi:cellulose synthase/poly-beta-1,6-N-acetylglucosamine synthase-like glycosyltransferase
MKADSDMSLPPVTVIMPVRNAANYIGRSLQGLLSQDYPLHRVEVLVVDGMSEDSTRDIVAQLASALHDTKEENGLNQNISIRLLDNPDRVVPAALNIGLEHARGEVIFRLDGHSEMANNYLSTCVRRLLRSPKIACVGGFSVATGTGWVGEAYASALGSPFGVGGSTFRTLRTEAFVDTLAFGCYRREVFDQIGGFDTELWRNQDIEFSARLRKAGYQLLLIGETQTNYYGPRNLAGIVRQSYNNGYWNLRVLHKMVGVLSWRHFVPGVFVISLVIASIAALTSRGSWLLVVILCAYLLASMVASAVQALRGPIRNALLLPLIFPLMHVSYGVGSIVGVLCFFLASTFRLLRKAEAA